jgi:hypothetical protein
MNNVQMLKRKYIMRKWIDPRVTPDRVELYRKLLAHRLTFNPSRLP